ncbi:unnamed protein product [Linum tenue]|uniref:DUF4378 domain-containing protein n=1 Tax=Linum tenue TaxID=586396 RepID=A0AAV0PI90_9ROSI|nr:unnamed protein product [Linum tenue]
MGCSEDYNPGSRGKHFVKHLTCRKQFSLANEGRRPPTLLKDFLLEDSITCASSSGFKSLPRKQPDGPKKMLTPQTSKSTVSALRAMINAVKSIQFVKNPPSILPRSLSRRLLSRKTSSSTKQDSFQFASVRIAVTVKDIIRWKSFRDLQQEEEEARELSTPHCSIDDTTETASSSGSKGSSWCDSDFSSEWWWQGESGDFSGKKLGNFSPGVGGGNFAEETAGENAKWAEGVGQPAEPASDDDVTWIASADDRSETTSSSSPEEDHKTEDATSAASYEEEEGIFHKAWQLLDRVRAGSGKHWRSHEEQLLLDFFMDELMAMGSRDNKAWKQDGGKIAIINGGAEKEEEEEEEMVIAKARAWIDEDRGEVINWMNESVVGSKKRDACIQAMDKEGNWSKLGRGGEGKEVGLGIEDGLFDDLINGLVADILIML